MLRGMRKPTLVPPDPTTDLVYLYFKMVTNCVCSKVSSHLLGFPLTRHLRLLPRIVQFCPLSKIYSLLLVCCKLSRFPIHSMGTERKKFLRYYEKAVFCKTQTTRVLS